MILTDPEVFIGAIDGISRLLSSRKQGMKHRYGWHGDPNPWVMNIEGACAERMVGKALGVYCTGFLGHGDDGRDVGDVQVRCSFKHLDGCLILHDTDINNRPYVLVTGSVLDNTMAIRGWCYGDEGKQKKYKKAVSGRKPEYYIPQCELRPIKELKMLLGGQGTAQYQPKEGS